MTQSHSVIEAGKHTSPPIRPGKWDKLFENLRNAVQEINAPASSGSAVEDGVPWLFEFDATSAQDHFRHFPTKKPAQRLTDASGPDSAMPNPRVKREATEPAPADHRTASRPRWSHLPVGSFRVGPNHLGVREIIVTREGEAHLIGEATKLSFGSLFPALDSGCFAAQNGCGTHKGGDVDIATNSKGHVLELHPEHKLDKAFSLSMCINGVWSSTPVLVS